MNPYVLTHPEALSARGARSADGRRSKEPNTEQLPLGPAGHILPRPAQLCKRDLLLVRCARFAVEDALDALLVLFPAHTHVSNMSTADLAALAARLEAVTSRPKRNTGLVC
jgi:hypothetical protein